MIKKVYRRIVTSGNRFALMSNIIAFYPKSTRTTPGSDVSRTIGPAASELDGAAFAHATEMGWLAEDLRTIAIRLEASVRSLGAELSAADLGLPLPFVAGFASHVARPERSLAAMVPLAVQQT